MGSWGMMSTGRGADGPEVWLLQERERMVLVDGGQEDRATWGISS